MVATTKEWEARKKRWERWRKRQREDEVFAREQIVLLASMLVGTSLDNCTNRRLYDFEDIILAAAAKITKDC